MTGGVGRPSRFWPPTSGEVEDDADGEPDCSEERQYPKEEGGLADRKPMELDFLDAEPRTALFVPGAVVLDDFAASRVGRIRYDDPVCVHVYGPPALRPRLTGLSAPHAPVHPEPESYAH
jgi:hypothetical protein